MLFTALWTAFSVACLLVLIYGVKNRKYIEYPCAIRNRFQLSSLSVLVLGTALFMADVILNPGPPC